MRSDSGANSCISTTAFLAASMLGLASASFLMDTQAAAPTNSAVAPIFPEQSVYQLDSTWTNDYGRKLKLEKLRGRVQVVVMFYANCQYACPILIQDLKRIEKALPTELRDRVGFTLVSFDSERDTAAALHEYRTA